MKNINKCIDCSIKISKNATRCKPCSLKGEKNPNYKDGGTKKDYFCICCNTKITYWSASLGSGRCKECSDEERSVRMKGKNNPNYKDGRSLKENFCVDCNKKLKTWTSERCASCTRKGERCCNWKGGISLVDNFCVDCGKKLTNYKSLRCSRCNLIRIGSDEKIKKKRIKTLKEVFGYDKILTKKYLITEYVTKNKIPSKIANEVKCSVKTILNYLHKRNIRVRTTVESRRGYLGMSNPNYIDGRSFLPYPVEFSSKLKKKIRQRDNYTCQLCGMTEIESLAIYQQILHCHHIDYDKKHNEETNLSTLCLSCNCRVNFRRKHWTKYFQNKLIRSKK